MPGGHRSVRGKDRGPAYLLKSRIEAFASVDQLTHSLKRYERRVSLVQMPDHWLVPQRAKRPDTADAQYDLLLESCFAIAAVKSR